MSSKLSTQNYKGARDFYPEQMRLQKHIFSVWRSVCEQFGYEEYNAPILEYTEIYEAKSGQEIVNEEMYTLVDKANRRLAIRPEMTPTVSRMVAARRQELAYPLRWYSIPNLWRYDRPQRGRLREHWQLNVDIFGVDSIYAELELIQIANGIMRRFGAKPTMYEFRLNSRVFVDYVLNEYLKLDSAESHTVIKLIDKMHKISAPEFISLIEASISPTQREEDSTVNKLLEVLRSKSIDDLPEDLKTHQSLDGLRQLIVMLNESGIKNVRFDVSLMRGFDYYTDVVFEVFDLHPDNNRSMFGGGRYDGLVGLFGVEPVPTVGFGQGDVGLELFLGSHDLLPNLHPETELYVCLLVDVAERAQDLLAKIRHEEVRVAVDYSGKKLGAQIKSADKQNIRFVLVVGEEELAKGQYNLKDLKTSKEQTLSLERVISQVKDHRAN